MAGWQLSPGAALAQANEDEGLGPEDGAIRPAGPDERSGHFLLQGRVGYLTPFGSVATDLGARSVVGGGPAFGANLGLGLSRYTVLELSGSYAVLSGADRCEGCSGRSLDLGLGLVYHLAQGIAFDPWIGYGVGYRRATYEGSARIRGVPLTFSDTAFHGLDVARIALGGDFYPIPQLGFGPYLELDAGTFVSRPAGFGQTTYGFFQAGIRVSLDPIRRGAAPTRAARRAPPPSAAAAPRSGDAGI
jgi:hypothetical protein